MFHDSLEGRMEGEPLPAVESGTQLSFTSVCGALFVLFDSSGLPLGNVYAYLPFCHSCDGSSCSTVCFHVRLAEFACATSDINLVVGTSFRIWANRSESSAFYSFSCQVSNAYTVGLLPKFLWDSSSDILPCPLTLHPQLLLVPV